MDNFVARLSLGLYKDKDLTADKRRSVILKQLDDFNGPIKNRAWQCIKANGADERGLYKCRAIETPEGQRWLYCEHKLDDEWYMHIRHTVAGGINRIEYCPGHKQKWRMYSLDGIAIDYTSREDTEVFDIERYQNLQKLTRLALKEMCETFQRYELTLSDFLEGRRSR